MYVLVCQMGLQKYYFLKRCAINLSHVFTTFVSYSTIECMLTFRTNIFSIVLIVLLAVSCSRSPQRVGQAVSVAVPVDSVYDHVSDSAYIRVLEPIKADLDRQMSAEIGFAAVPLTVGQPESTLSNWSSDVLRLSAKPYCGARGADVAIVNVGGLRCDIPAGSVPLRKIYELMPFDNELVILTLRGSDLLELCDLFAAVGGQGVSGLRFGIGHGKARNVTVGGREVRPEQEYVIATSDYLAGGNDNMMPLARYTSRQDTGMKIRDIFIDFVRQETAAGQQITASLDGRIVFL